METARETKKEASKRDCVDEIETERERKKEARQR